MLPPEQPDRIHVAFDDHHLVANAGLILPVTLAHRLGLGELADCHVDLGDAPGRANPKEKMLALVASALAGGDCIDDADVLRTGWTAATMGCVVKAPSTLGTFLRSFQRGHVRQLDRVSREVLARAWAVGAGPVSMYRDFRPVDRQASRPCLPSPSPWPAIWRTAPAPAPPSPRCVSPRPPSPRPTSGRSWVTLP